MLDPSLIIFKLLVTDAEYRSVWFTEYPSGKRVLRHEYRAGDDRHWNTIPDYTKDKWAVSQLSARLCREHKIGISFVSGPLVHTAIYSRGKTILAVSYGRTQDDAHRNALTRLIVRLNLTEPEKEPAQIKNSQWRLTAQI